MDESQSDDGTTYKAVVMAAYNVDGFDHRSATYDFSGSVSGFLGDYASAHNTIFNNIGTVSPTAVRNGELNLSGPVVKDRLWFFTSGRYFRNEGSAREQTLLSLLEVEHPDAGEIAALVS